jgi:hypothetical protein
MPTPMVRAFVMLAAVAAWAGLGRAFAADIAAAVSAPAPVERPVSICIRWGGGTPQAWAGRIEVVDGEQASTRPTFTWRTLCTEPDAAAMAHESAGAVVVHQRRPVADDGIVLTVSNWRRARIVVRLGASDGRQPPVDCDVEVADVMAEAVQRPLDAAGNRLSIKRPPTDALRITVEAADGLRPGAEPMPGMVRRPGDRVRLRVEPMIPMRGRSQGGVELRLRLHPARQATDVDGQATLLTPVAAAADADGVQGRSIVSFEPVVFDVTLPKDEGVYEVDLEAVDRAALRWTKPIVSRTVQIVAVADRPPEAADATAWTTLYELDPGSPRLHERLRRLPGVTLPAVPLPTMPLPSISRAASRLPAVPLPNVPLPNVALPNVPLPNVASMVPRFGGLLAAGDSVVVPHRLGPMLRLPSARKAGQPSWEGITVASARPGVPHLVEIDYPDDQDAVFGIAVLESDPAGSPVEVRHAGGFEVVQPRYSAAEPKLGVHRFVFWPTTRHPLVVIANAAVGAEATFGRVRVQAAATRLSPARPAGGAAKLAATVGRRRAYAFLEGADLVDRFGGVGRADAAGANAVADRFEEFTAIRHSAEALAADGVAGAMVTVFGDGAALWPSAAMRRAVRWGDAIPTESGPGESMTDFVGVLSRVYAREGLSLMPALRFDSPLPAVEAALAAGDAGDGIACVGRDGRPRRLPGGGMHYNILDPRVQAAVESLVLELAGRLRDAPGVEGIALVMPADGWLHLPGTAWGLDDVTFGRFVATVEGSSNPEGEGRHTERARLVEGPLREPWLRWRCAEIARFQSRIADRLAAIDGRWSLAIVPTTLAAADEFAGRFRPSLVAAPPGDAARELGLDPGSLPADAARRIVFVAPVMHAPVGDARQRAGCEAAGRALAFAGAARRGVVLVEEPVPLDISAAASHGPFGGATFAGPCLARSPRGTSRGLAESLAAADAEMLVDMGFIGGATESPARRGFESLPALPLAGVPGLRRPLVVRTCQAGGVTWAMFLNAGAAPASVMASLGGRPSTAVDAVDGTSLPVTAGREVEVLLDPWAVRAVILDGGVSVDTVRVTYGDGVSREVAARMERLRAKRAALDTPVPLDVLDNPAFELGPAGVEGKPTPVSGWEVLEPRRGSVAIVPGASAAGEAGRAVQFSSTNGLATLRSNPFLPPRTGRVSVAAWLRLPPGIPQPPLRIAIEAVQGGTEYYRFAAVGGLAGGRPLTDAWSQFVLQVDDVPVDAIESMRVRFDLLGPGQVEIDDVRVFDLAFDESQRAQLTKLVSLLEHEFEAGEIGTCVAALEGYWPVFLETFVTDATIAAAASLQEQPASGPAPTRKPEQRQAGGVLDRFRSWWQ